MLYVESAENLQRVDSLLKLYIATVDADLGTESERSEILRSAVVFLHASIEEIVRNLYVERLPIGRTEYINEIAYPPYGVSNRSKGVLLGDLLKNHGGKIVENVILEAINAHVDTLNINNSRQLVSHLQKLDINTDPLAPLLEDLDAAMKRRHQIVHQMDRDDSLDPDRRTITEIDFDDVRKWFLSTLEFTKQIILQLPD